mmetsp:Transcript_10869/g.45064  ORF Transcript_10869/g.45064 Transcript_10869/m.45064 type:complete len:242 (+) Transcript_10869:3-728(+)
MGGAPPPQRLSRSTARRARARRCAIGTCTSVVWTSRWRRRAIRPIRIRWDKCPRCATATWRSSSREQSLRTLPMHTAALIRPQSALTSPSGWCSPTRRSTPSSLKKRRTEKCTTQACGRRLLRARSRRLRRTWRPQVRAPTCCHRASPPPTATLGRTSCTCCNSFVTQAMRNCRQQRHMRSDAPRGRATRRPSERRRLRSWSVGSKLTSRGASQRRMGCLAVCSERVYEAAVARPALCPSP